METKRALEIIEQFPTKKVLVIGDFCLDEYIFGETDELSPEFPVLRLFLQEKKHFPGAAGNVALGVRSLEAHTYAVGVVGKDENGAILLQKLSQQGINTEGIIQIENRHTPTYSRIVYGGQRGQKRPKQHLARLDLENKEPLSKETHQKLKQILQQKISEVDAVIVADYEEIKEMGTITPEIIELIAFLGKTYQKKTIAISRKRIHLFKNFTTIIPNDLEARKAMTFITLNKDTVFEEDLKKIAEQLRSELNLEGVIITRGAEGISILEKNSDFWKTHPSLAKKIVDVCGAGDTVTSTITLSLLSGANFSESALLGNYAASITVSKEGTCSVTKKELLEKIKNSDKSQKIVSLEELKLSLHELKEKQKKKQKVIFLNGYFDPIHIGHIELINKAKKIAPVEGIVVIGLNSDRSVRENKGPDRPFLHQEKRAEILSGLESIDYVILFDELTPINLIKELKPDFIVKGSNYKKEEVVGKEIIEAYGGEVILIDTINGLSSDGVLESIQGRKENLRHKINKTLELQQGILFAEPAVVYRGNYSGRNILAKNSKFSADYVDERGYLPVEWWIMSKTTAENERIKENEGLSALYLETDLGKEKIFFKEAVEFYGEKLLGNFTALWPLTKILDIGGETVNYFGTEEVPPIPCHVHSGKIVDGKCMGNGKLEAYFFPPINIAPYQQNFNCQTRLGLKPNVTLEEVKERLKHFGHDDSFYELCQNYEIKPYDGWTILPGVVHAPGPWTTFEIQLPQDDFNLCSWQLGQKLLGTELEEKKNSLQLRGLENEEVFVKEVINWDVSTITNFKEKYYQPAKILQQGPWGRQLQIFFDSFYGEAFEIAPGQSWIRNSDHRPLAGIVWSGQGWLNGNEIDANNKERKEFLIVPNTLLTIKNTGTAPLLIYTVFPMNKIINKMIK